MGSRAATSRVLSRGGSAEKAAEGGERKYGNEPLIYDPSPGVFCML